MEDLPHRRHGNFPQRRATLLPQEAKCRPQLALEAMSSETGPIPASRAEEPSLPTEHLSSTEFCETEKEPNWCCNGKTTAASPSSEKQQHPDKSVAALLKRIRIHPEAQRILGNSSIAVVSLERLNFQSVSLSSLQPVVSLVRLPSACVELHNDVCCWDPPQQHPPLNNQLQYIQRSPPHRDRLPDEFVSVPGSDAAAPADSSEEYCTCHNGLVEDLQHLTEHIEGPKLPQDVESALSLPVDSLCVAFPVQSVVDVDSKNGFSHNEADMLDIEEETPQSNPAEPFDLPETTMSSWTEPYCPDSSSSPEPEQDSGFDCDSNPDQPYILFDSGSEEWDPDGKTDSETLYLDPDPEPTMVIALDPEPESDQDQSLQLEDESESKCEANVVQMNNSEDQRERSCSPTQEVIDSSIQKPETGAASEEIESEDFCAVCLNGGDLLCCDCCPKVYHLACHIPPLISFPLGDWVCTLCRTDHEPAEAYDCENMHPCAGFKALYTLSNEDQRRCEKLTLLLYCHLLSAPFHEPVSPLARNYYQIIKRPVDLSVIRRKLDKSNTLHYFTAEQFVDDVLLMFKNCATFNYPDSEVAQAGRNLEVFFLSKLKDIFPDRTFPSASQDRMDRARLQWFNRKRKENYRKKRCVFRGKKYYV
ncbi:E3 ubiquitin-protein ligase TRIM33-like isoform X1 [Thunnus maccoyii]|uniref:E3 ubiquitin-protein ligase TRIM33-like isoform X1 n=1 Tax=Thunnus maccoyii TaxID=8240 RepID=UPI001C4D45FF|nr:E3 ubiquitin-protein ligase TRIM33-like isoform X1 [Thunnus maccoyii]